MPRHQTLRAVVDWSWDLLDEAERRCGAGSPSSRAARPWRPPSRSAPGLRSQHGGIAADQILDLLTALADKSLLVVRHGPGRAAVPDAGDHQGLRAGAAGRGGGAGRGARGARARTSPGWPRRARTTCAARQQLDWLAPARRGPGQHARGDPRRDRGRRRQDRGAAGRRARLVLVAARPEDRGRRADRGRGRPCPAPRRRRARAPGRGLRDGRRAGRRHAAAAETGASSGSARAAALAAQRTRPGPPDHAAGRPAQPACYGMSDPVQGPAASGGLRRRRGQPAPVGQRDRPHPARAHRAQRGPPARRGGSRLPGRGRPSWPRLGERWGQAVAAGRPGQAGEQAGRPAAAIGHYRQASAARGRVRQHRGRGAFPPVHGARAVAARRARGSLGRAPPRPSPTRSGSACPSSPPSPPTPRATWPAWTASRRWPVRPSSRRCELARPHG